MTDNYCHKTSFLSFFVKVKAFFGFPVPDADRRVAEKRRKRKKSVFGSTFNFLGGRRKLHFRRKSPKKEKKKKCKGSKNEKNIGALFWRKNGFRSNSMIWLHRATVEQPWASFFGSAVLNTQFFWVRGTLKYSEVQVYSTRLCTNGLDTRFFE